ncbi:MAG: methyltransferase domain-containing protein [Thermodesulfobacteriota bacterium]|nr:methyltransferase domain-containing protein [Thermodesulfobacteriota bacterium]
MPGRLCPVWIGYLLVCPVRKWFQNPEKILGPYVEVGMKALDIGCAMGFFSLPLARMVGSSGKVICVDVQEKMILSLEKRVRKSRLADRIETRVCTENSLNLDDITEEIDFALACAVVHEVPDVYGFFSDTYKTISPTGRLLLFEPGGHVSEKDFTATISAARQNDFQIVEKPKIGRSHAVLLAK